MAVREKFDPNGPYAPRAEPKPPNELDPTKCVAAQLGAVGNERQCTGDRVDGEWCERHSPETRARWRLERQTTAFQDAVQEWEVVEDKRNRIYEQRDAIAKKINDLFEEVVTEQQLLADLPWKVTHANLHHAVLFCRIKDERVDKFLDQMKWENISWHHTLKIGDIHIYCNDGDMEISFSTMQELQTFCKTQGIKPDLHFVIERQKTAQREAEELGLLLKGFE
jgi:hypothetical protein